MFDVWTPQLRHWRGHDSLEQRTKHKKVKQKQKQGEKREIFKCKMYYYYSLTISIKQDILKHKTEKLPSTTKQQIQD